MEHSAGARATGEDEGLHRRKLFGQPIDLGLEPRDVLRGDPRDFLRRGLGVGRGELGPQRKQLALEGVDQRAQVAFRHFLSRDAERGIELVDVAVRGNAQVVLADPRSSEEARRSVIAAPGVDLCQAASCAR